VIGYLGVTKSDVTEQRDHVQAQVSTLKARVATLMSHNADLRQQLEAASGGSGAPKNAHGADIRPLEPPLPDEGSPTGLFLDEGSVDSGTVNSSDLILERQASTGRVQLTSRTSTGYSTAVNSADVSQEACSQAVMRSPANKPIPVRSGLLVCVLTDGGTSLLQIQEAPQNEGALKISQKFWPEP